MGISKLRYRSLHLIKTKLIAKPNRPCVACLLNDGPQKTSVILKWNLKAFHHKQCINRLNSLQEPQR